MSIDWDEIDDDFKDVLLDAMAAAALQLEKKKKISGRIDPHKHPEMYKQIIAGIKGSGKVKNGRTVPLSNRDIVKVLASEGVKTNAGVVSKILNGKSPMPRTWLKAIPAVWRKL